MFFGVSVGSKRVSKNFKMDFQNVPCRFRWFQLAPGGFRTDVLSLRGITCATDDFQGDFWASRGLTKIIPTGFKSNIKAFHGHSCVSRCMKVVFWG